MRRRSRMKTLKILRLFAQGKIVYCLLFIVQLLIIYIILHNIRLLLDWSIEIPMI